MKMFIGFAVLFSLAISAYGGVFRDDFSSGNLDKWTPAPEELTRDWKIENGELISGEAPLADGRLSPAFLIIGEDDWQDYVIEANVLYPKPKKLPHPGANFLAGVGLRILVGEKISGYCLGIGVDSGGNRLARVFSFNQVILQTMGTKQSPFEYDKWYRLRMTTEREHFKCFLDDELLFKFDDFTFLAGKVGLGSCALARFDNVIMKGPDVPDWDSKAVFPQGKLAVTWGKVKMKF